MTMRLALATTYLEARVEYALAARAGHPARVGLDELARLGFEAFGSGAEGDALQLAVDTLANRTAQIAGTAPSERSSASAVAVDLNVDRVLLDAGLDVALLRSLRGLAEAAATAIMKRDATVHGNGATRSVAGPQAIVTHYRGVWESGTYVRGAMATHDGTLWFCEADSTSDRPGSSKSWRLMVKNKERAPR